jgi:hypothetical protein
MRGKTQGRRALIPLAACAWIAAAFLGAAGVARAADAVFTPPADDQWQFPFNGGSVADDTEASCFAGPSSGPFAGQFNYRDGMLILPFDTATAATPGVWLKVLANERDRDGDAGKRQIKVSSQDAGIAAPTAGSADDPRSVGAVLTVKNPSSGETTQISLPGAHWSGLGRPEGSGGYKYSDKDRVAGPCKSGYWKPGKLKMVCTGPLVTYTLDEPTQGAIAAVVESGTLRACAAFGGPFGGTVLKDVPAASGRTGTFKVKSAPPPVACPPE